jgi:hypothetical protein
MTENSVKGHRRSAAVLLKAFVPGCERTGPMTRLAKILIFVNLAFSFGMMAWALALYTNRVDFSNNKAQGDQPAGELVKRVERIEELKAAFRPAETAWLNARTSVQGLEARRAADHDWYASELVFLRTGATAANPARAVVYELGSPAPDTKDPGRAKMKPATGPMNQPLESLKAYEGQLKDAHDLLARETERYEKAIKEDTDLTNKLAGYKDKDDKEVKGLRQRIVDERAKLVNLNNEHKFVKPLLVNAFVESQLVLKRADALRARIKELQNVGVAAGRRADTPAK